MDRRGEVTRIFPRDLRALLGRMSLDFDEIQEIRLRAGRPLLIVSGNREYAVDQDGQIWSWGSSGNVRGRQPREAYRVTAQQIKETMEFMSSYSLYAFEEEMRQGFITIQGGHRIGVAGQTVTDKQGVRLIKFISFINVRVAHQIKGCADPVLPYLYDPSGDLYNTLLISPPCRGKTTLLRDMIRQISDGWGKHGGMTVGVADERSELGACYQGIPQNDLGMRTDVLDCCPKAAGMMMLIRSMSPRVVAVDEIGSVEDMRAIDYVRSCGCRLIATVHGRGIKDIQSKPVLGELIANQVFRRFVVLGGKRAGCIEAVLDESGNLQGGGVIG